MKTKLSNGSVLLPSFEQRLQVDTYMKARLSDRDVHFDQRPKRAYNTDSDRYRQMLKRELEAKREFKPVRVMVCCDLETALKMFRPEFHS